MSLNRRFQLLTVALISALKLQNLILQIGPCYDMGVDIYKTFRIPLFQKKRNNVY